MNPNDQVRMPLARLLSYGIIVAILGEVMGSVVFALLFFGSFLTDSFLAQPIFEILSLSLLWMGLVLVGGVPAVVGGGLLSMSIHRALRKGNLVEAGALLQGVVIGGVTVLLFCLLLTAFSYIVGPGHGFKYSIESFDWLRYSLYTIAATCIAGFFGGWTGQRVFNYLIKNGVGT